MSAYVTHPKYCIRFTLMTSNVDRLLGFVSGISASILTGVIFYLTIMDGAITGYSLALALASFVTLLLLYGVPINRIEVMDKFRIEFEVRNGDK